MRLSVTFQNKKEKKNKNKKTHPDPIDKHLFINFHFISTGLLYFDVDAFSFAAFRSCSVFEMWILLRNAVGIFCLCVFFFCLINFV